MIIANSLEELTNIVYLAYDTVVHGAMYDDGFGKIKLYDINNPTLQLRMSVTLKIEWKL